MGCLGACDGIAILPSLGVVAAVSDDSVFALRLSDGIRVGSLAVPNLWMFLAADDATGAVYGNVASSTGYDVHAWNFSADGASIRTMSNGPVTAAGTRSESRPLTVIPPAPCKAVSYLVVGTGESSELLVLSLPSLALTHTHTLEGMDLTGLAADPSGGALAVFDRESGALHVLAWPLPGMPPLQ